eukprot:5533421-Lingulodinium_polyedra.AAC.1
MVEVEPRGRVEDRGLLDDLLPHDAGAVRAPTLLLDVEVELPPACRARAPRDVGQGVGLVTAHEK